MPLIILIPLALMILSDYRTRTILLWQLLLFGTTVLIIGWLENGLRTTCANLAINIILSLLIGICVYIYFLIKQGSVGSVIGKGDILFILFLTPFFRPRVFLVFMTVAFTATLLVWIIASSIRKKEDNIPLVSGVGVSLFLLLIYQQIIILL